MTDRYIKMKLKDQEYRQIAEAARQAGMSTEAYIRQRLGLDKPPVRAKRPTARMGAVGDVEVKADLEGRPDAGGSDDVPDKRPRRSRSKD